MTWFSSIFPQLIIDFYTVQRLANIHCLSFVIHVCTPFEVIVLDHKNLAQGTVHLPFGSVFQGLRTLSILGSTKLVFRSYAVFEPWTYHFPRWQDVNARSYVCGKSELFLLCRICCIGSTIVRSGNFFVAVRCPVEQSWGE